MSSFLGAALEELRYVRVARPEYRARAMEARSWGYGLGSATGLASFIGVACDICVRSVAYDPERMFSYESRIWHWIWQ